MKRWGSRRRARADEGLPAAKPPPAEVGADRGRAYQDYVVQHLGSAAEDDALREAIGGEFDTIGRIQADLLIAHGLREDSHVVDIGCGSGRTALPLSQVIGPEGSYVGTDVVPALLDYARRLTQRENFRFFPADDFNIPADDDAVDIVSFFSVFTHLRHEHSYLYLQEAKRVLKPEGRIIFSFLEFAIYSHWDVFRHNYEAPFADKPLDQFMSRDGIEAWAHHLGLEIVEILDGDKPNIPLSQPVTMGHGAQFTDLAPLGQSVAVLRQASAG